MLKEAYVAAGTLGLTIIPVMARTLDDLGDAFAKMHSENCDALFVLADPRINQIGGLSSLLMSGDYPLSIRAASLSIWVGC